MKQEEEKLQKKHWNVRMNGCFYRLKNTKKTLVQFTANNKRFSVSFKAVAFGIYVKKALNLLWSKTRMALQLAVKLLVLIWKKQVKLLIGYDQCYPNIKCVTPWALGLIQKI